MGQDEDAQQQQQRPGNRRAVSNDWCEMTTFHVVSSNAV
jgi:hypothetical protein